MSTVNRRRHVGLDNEDNTPELAPAKPKNQSNRSPLPPRENDIDFMDENPPVNRISAQADEAFIASNARKIGDFASPDEMSEVLIKFRELEGAKVVVTAVEFKTRAYRGDDVESAFITAHYPHNPAEDIKIVGAGYMVIAQLKHMRDNNLIPFQGRFMQNPNKNNRWEIVD